MVRGTKQKEAAWIFITWMMEADTQHILYNTALFPSRTDVLYGHNKLSYPVSEYMEPYWECMKYAFFVRRCIIGER